MLKFLERIWKVNKRWSKVVFMTRFERAPCPVASELQISAPVSLKAGSFSKEQFAPLCVRMLCKFVQETAGMRVNPIKCL